MNKLIIGILVVLNLIVFYFISRKTEKLQTGPPETGPPETGPPGMGPPEMGPPEMGPPEMGPPEMGPLGMGPPEMGPPGMGPPGMGPPGMGPPEMGPPEMGPPGMEGMPSTDMGVMGLQGIIRSGPGKGEASGSSSELGKSICFNRKLESECEPLNEQHKNRCMWIGSVNQNMTPKEKMDAKSKHFCVNEAFLKCQRYIKDAEGCENAGCEYDENQVMCLPKNYNFEDDKCSKAYDEEANDEEAYDEVEYENRKGNCSPDNGCLWVDGYCKVWEPETTTAVAGPIPDSAPISAQISAQMSAPISAQMSASMSAPMISPMIPTRIGKTNSEALKQFSEDTGCLLYNEPASDRIQCKPSPYMSSTMAPQPETTISPDNMPSYSANGELIENPFHQLREIDLILNKF